MLIGLGRNPFVSSAGNMEELCTQPMTAVYLNKTTKTGSSARKEVVASRTIAVAVNSIAPPLVFCLSVRGALRSCAIAQVRCLASVSSSRPNSSISVIPRAVNYPGTGYTKYPVHCRVTLGFMSKI